MALPGDVFEVLGRGAYSGGGAVPPELIGQKVTLLSADGASIEVDAPAVCISRVLKDAAVRGELEFKVPVKKPILSKIVEYMNYHQDVAPVEIRLPLVSDNLAECGASKWDASFASVDKDALFDLMVQATSLQIPSLLYLMSAKASLMVKGKTADKLRKEFGMTNDLPADEEEGMSDSFTETTKRKNAVPDEAGLAGQAVILQGMYAAAKKSGILDASSVDGVDPKSFRHMSWLTAVNNDWKEIMRAPAQVRGDRDLVRSAIISSGGAALAFASQELKSDKGIVLEAVKYQAEALKEAAPALRGNKDFVLEAIMINGTALAGATAELQGDKTLVLEAARKGRGSALKGASLALRSDQSFVLQCVAADPEALKYAAEDLIDTTSFLVSACSTNGAALQHVPAKFKADMGVVGAALSSDPTAMVYAHTAVREKLAMEAPWDSQPALKMEKLAQDKAGVGHTQPAPAGAYTMGVPLTLQGEAGSCFSKTFRMVQFSALSTMMGNMGQANYVAANAYLDKMPYYERPVNDSVTLMWGAVGNIGMRWKAFASQDMLNANPDALMQVADAAKVLCITTAKLDVPEWYAGAFFDDYSRQVMLSQSAGKASETYLPSPASARREDQEIEKKREDRYVESTPLGGWPGLAAPSYQPGATAEPALGLALGSRVELVKVSMRSGARGTVVKQTVDGRWKVRLDNCAGMALLKSSYLQAVPPPIAAVPPQQQPQVAEADEEPEVEDAEEVEAVEEKQEAPKPRPAITRFVYRPLFPKN